MSLGIAFKGSEGIVLAADSRVTLTARRPGPTPGSIVLLPATFDNATKLLKVKGQDFVGAVTFGVGALGVKEPRTAHSFLNELEADLEKAGVGRLSVEEFSKRLGEFFLAKWKAAGMAVPAPDTEQMFFLIGGFDEGAVYGRLFEVAIPNRPIPKEQMPGEFGALWGGQHELVDRLLHGFDSRLPGLIKSELKPTPADEAKFNKKLRQLSITIPFQFLPLQDCVDLSVLLIRTTINLQTWTVGVRGVGGAIDVATVTQTHGFRPLQQKTVKVSSQKES